MLVHYRKPNIKWLGVLLLTPSPMDGMLVHHRIPSIKWLGALLLPTGGNASPSQDSQHKVTESINTPPPPRWDASLSQDTQHKVTPWIFVRVGNNIGMYQSNSGIERRFQNRGQILRNLCCCMLGEILLEYSVLVLEYSLNTPWILCPKTSTDYVWAFISYCSCCREWTQLIRKCFFSHVRFIDMLRSSTECLWTNDWCKLNKNHHFCSIIFHSFLIITFIKETFFLKCIFVSVRWTKQYQD